MDDRNKNGTFKKGSTPNPKGRPVGVKNKATQKIRESFLQFIENNLDRMQEDFDQLEAKDRFKYLFEMSKFILPNLKSIEFGNILEELTEDQFKEVIEKIKSEFSNN